MKVTYIFHSSFAVELEENVLIFDYYGEVDLARIPDGKKVWFLNSHAHQYHFQRKILELKAVFPDAEYILSRDIRFRPEERKDWIHSVRAREEYEFGALKVRTLRSTDMGVAYVVRADGKKIYHAGDLNWWHWDGEDKAWNNNMAANYKREVDKLEGEELDAAFVPLDPRLGDAYCWGMKYFLEHVHAEAVFPMHCWGDYSVCRKVRKLDEMKGLLGPFQDVAYTGQEWILC